MKKGKFLAVAALISCCTVLAACGNGETSSSAEPSSSTSSSEPVSSDDSTSGYSSDDSGSGESSSSDSSSSDSSSTGGDTPSTSQATLTLSVENNIYAYVYTASGSVADPSNDERILGVNYDYSVLSATVDVGSYVYIENLNSAADYTVSYSDGTSLTGTLEAYGEGISDLIEVTGDLSISLTAYVSQTSEIAEINNYSPNIISGISLEVGDEYTAGSQVSYSFTGSQYTAQSNADASAYGYYVTVNGTTYNPSSVTWNSSSNVVYSGTFEMPEDDAEIDIVYYNTTVSDTGFTASFDEDENGYVRCLSISSDPLTYGINSSITFVLKKAIGVSVTGIQYSTDNGSSWSDTQSASVLTLNGNTDSDILYSTIYGATFSEGDSVLVKALYTADNAYYGLTLANADNVTINTGSSYSSHPLAGDSIYISYSAKDGKYVSAAATVTDASGNAVETTTNTTSALRFTMPAYDVYISFHVSDQIKVETEENEWLASQITVRTYRSSTSTLDYVTPGQTVYICADPLSGYLLNGFTVNGESITDLDYYSNYAGTSAWYYAEYTLPEDATQLKISANVAKGYTVSSGISNTYGSLTIGDGATNTYAAGDSVSFTITPTSYYSVKSDSVIVSAGSSTVTASVTYNSDGSATGSFTMPSSDVTITAEFDNKSTTSLYFDTTSVNSYLRTAYVIGNSSGTTLYNAAETAESGSFIVGETVSIYVRYDVSTYDYSINAVTSSGTTALSLNYDNSTSSVTVDYTVTSDLLGFTVTASEKAPLNITTSVEDGISITYAYVSADSDSTRIYQESQLTKVDSFDGIIYSGYSCYIKVESTVEGKGADVAVTDTATGSEIGSFISLYNSGSDLVDWYSFSPNADFTITATLVNPYTVNIDYGDGISADYVYIQDVTSSPFSMVTDGESFNAGSTIRIRNMDYSTIYYYVDYVTGTDASGSLAYQSYHDFSLTSSITIYLRTEEITSNPGGSSEEGDTTGGETSSTSTIKYVSEIDTSVAYFDVEDDNDMTVYAGTEDGITTISEGTAATGVSCCIYCGYGAWSASYRYTVDFDSSSYTDVSGTVESYGWSSVFTLLGDCTVTITA